jgi:hypothetical protein
LQRAILKKISFLKRRGIIIAKHKLFTVLLIVGLLFFQFAQPASVAKAQTLSPTNPTSTTTSSVTYQAGPDLAANELAGNQDNPVGVWSFGYRQARVSPALTLFTRAEHTSFGDCIGWRGFSGYSTPNALVNPYNSPIQCSTGVTLAPGEMMVHPGWPSSPWSYQVVRWTAPSFPSSGFVMLQATWTTKVATEVDTHIAVNGVSIFDGAASWSGTNYSSPTPIPVAAGDVIDFVVGNENGWQSAETGFFGSVTFSNPMGVIEGHVFTNDTSQPLAGASVEACPVSGAAACQAASTGSSGDYVILFLDDGDYTLRAFPPAGSPDLPNTLGPVTITGGNTLANQDITLFTTSTTASSVTYQAGPDLAANELAGAQANPVGVWSFGYRQALASPALTLFTRAEHTSFYDCIGWTGSFGYGTPSALVNPSNSPVLWSTGATIAPGEMVVHPGPPSSAANYQVVRWTAPSSGFVMLQATWIPKDTAEVDTHIVVNGVSIFNGTSVWSGTNYISPTPIPVVAGDVIDFAVGNENGFNSASTGFFGSVTLSNLNLTGAIEGHVFANDASQPLAGASVEACPVSGAAACQTTSTGSAGDYVIGFLDDGAYTLRAFPPAGTLFLPNTLGPVTITGGNPLTNQDITLNSPPPPPAGTDITPNRGLSGGDIPVVYWGDTLTLTTTGCPDATAATYTITMEDGQLASSGDMTEVPAGSGAYTASIPPFYPAYHGNAAIAFTITCPHTPTQSSVLDIYIDPSGTVQDTHGNPIAGATVTLFRSDAAGGPFNQVPDGDAVMSPANRTNPDITDAYGHFGWDVNAGYYFVRAEKAGCVSPTDPTQNYADTAVMYIPPEVTNLVLTLACTEKVNTSLNLTQVATSYDPHQAGAPSGVYTITATFKNISAVDLANIYFSVVTLTDSDNRLLNADGGPAGVGAILTAPGHVVYPGDSFQVAFNIGLNLRQNFTLTVDAYGVDPVTRQAVNLAPNTGSFTFTIHDLSGFNIFLPLVTH